MRARSERSARERRIACGALFASLCLTLLARDASADALMYLGTLDKKILVVDEDKQEVVGEIPMVGVPRVKLSIRKWVSKPST